MDASQDNTPTLVTGGTGFLGRPLVEYLLQRGARVRVSGRRPVARWRRDPRVEHIRADITGPGVIPQLLVGVERIVHLAAATQGDWETFRRVTVDATQTLLETFADQGGGRIVFVSSLGNYDGGAMTDGGVVDEDFPLEQFPQGREYYARTKVEAERIAHAYLTHPTVQLTIVRPGVIYGPGMKNPLTGVALSIKGKLWIVPGRGDKPVPLIFIDDAVQGLVQLMQCDQAIGRIYNMVHPHMPGQNEVVGLYRTLSGDRRPVVRVPLRSLVPLLALGDRLTQLLGGRNRHLAYKAARLVKRLSYSGQRLAQDTGFTPRVDLGDGLRRMFPEVTHVE